MVLQRGQLATAQGKQLQAFVDNEQYIPSAGFDQYYYIAGRYTNSLSITIFVDLPTPVIIEYVSLRFEGSGTPTTMEQLIKVYDGEQATNIWVLDNVSTELINWFVKPNLLMLPGQNIGLEIFPSGGTFNGTAVNYNILCRKVWAERLLPTQVTDL